AMAGAIAITLIVTIPTVLYLRGKSVEDTPLRHFSIAVPDNTLIGYVALSPNGRQLLTAEKAEANIDLVLYNLVTGGRSAVRGAENIRGPFWSPDSRFMGFFSQGKLKTMPATGGAAQSLCDAVVDSGATWGKDGVILFGAAGSLWRVAAGGGPCAVLLAGNNATPYAVPTFLPDGEHF